MCQGLQQNSYSHKIHSWKLGRMLLTSLIFYNKVHEQKLNSRFWDQESDAVLTRTAKNLLKQWGTEASAEIYSFIPLKHFFRRMFLEFILDTDFWIWHQKQKLQWKIKWDCIKLKAFCTAKEISSHQHTEKTTYWREENICKLPNC